MKNFASLLLLLLAGCKDSQTIYNETEDEAFKDVWEQVVDSVFIDKSMLVPPPYEMYVIETGNKKNIDTTGFRKVIDNWKKEQDSLSGISKEYIIAVEDSLADFDRFYYNKDLEKDSLIVAGMRKTTNPLLSNRMSSKKYRFVGLSNYHSNKSSRNYDEAYKATDGILYFSHIIFDKNHKKGAFEVGFSIGMKAGRGLIITIIKKNGKWIVSSIKEAYVT